MRAGERRRRSTAVRSTAVRSTAVRSTIRRSGRRRLAVDGVGDAVPQPGGAGAPDRARWAATSRCRRPRRGSGGTRRGGPRPRPARRRRRRRGRRRPSRLLDLVVASSCRHRLASEPVDVRRARPPSRLAARAASAPAADPALDRTFGLARGGRRPRGSCGRRSRRARSPGARPRGARRGRCRIVSATVRSHTSCSTS